MEPLAANRLGIFAIRRCEMVNDANDRAQSKINRTALLTAKKVVSVKPHKI